MSPFLVVAMSWPPDTLYAAGSSCTTWLNFVVSRLAPSNSSPEPPPASHSHGWSGSFPSSVKESNATRSPTPSASGPTANTAHAAAGRAVARLVRVVPVEREGVERHEVADAVGRRPEREHAERRRRHRVRDGP